MGVQEDSEDDLGNPRKARAMKVNGKIVVKVMTDQVASKADEAVNGDEDRERISVHANQRAMLKEIPKAHLRSKKIMKLQEMTPQGMTPHHQGMMPHQETMHHHRFKPKLRLQFVLTKLRYHQELKNVPLYLKSFREVSISSGRTLIRSFVQ